MLKDRDWILARLPHQGAMCLLDGVLDWDAEGVRCLSRAHRAPGNPLRAHGRLGAATGIEIAAQAMAVHGALLAGEAAPPAPGYLAAVRGVEIAVARLDDIDGDLEARVTRLAGDATTLLYGFTLLAGGRTLLAGRASIVLGGPALQAGAA